MSDFKAKIYQIRFGLSCGEESMTKYSAVLIQYQRVTDRRTDGQTDVQPIYLLRASAKLTHVTNCSRLTRKFCYYSSVFVVVVFFQNFVSFSSCGVD